MPSWIAVVLIGWLSGGWASAQLLVWELSEGGQTEAAGFREGDRLTGWRQGEQSGSFSDYFDLLFVDGARRPRGELFFLIERGEEQRAFPMPINGKMGWTIEAELAGTDRDAWEAAKSGLEKGRTEEVGRLVEDLVHLGKPATASWVHRAAALQLRSVEGAADLVAAEFAKAISLARTTEASLLLKEDLASWLTRQGETERAVGLMEDVVAGWRSTEGADLLLARNLDLLGRLEIGRGDLPRAEALHREAYALWQAKAPRSLSTTGSCHLLAIDLLMRGAIFEAEAKFREKLELVRAIDPGGIREANAEIGLGIVAYEKGDLDAAQEHDRRALGILDEVAPESVYMAAVLNNLGNVAGLRGDFETAAELLSRSIEMESRSEDEGSRDLRMAEGLSNLGELARRSGDLDQARSYLEEALALFEAHADDHLRLASVLVNLDAVEMESAEPDLARAAGYLARADELHRIAGSQGIDLATLRTHQGRLALRSGRPEAALERFGEGLEIARRLSPESLWEAQALFGTGRAENALGRTDAARERMMAGLDVLDRQAQRLGGSPNARMAYRSLYEDSYRAAIELLVDQGRGDRALATLERFRARTLLEMMASRQVDFSGEVPAELEAERRRLQGEYEGLQQAILGREELPEAEREALISQMRGTWIEIERNAETIRRSSPRLAALRDPEPLEVEAMAATLDEGMLFVTYSLSPEGGIVWALDAGGNLEVERIDAPRSRIQKLVEGLLALVPEARGDSRRARMRRRDLDRAAAELYDLLLAPVGDLVSSHENILITPDGALHALPWGLLRAPSQEDPASRAFLAIRASVEIVPSVTVYRELRALRDRPAAKTSIAAFGDPKGPASRERIETDPVLRSADARGFGFGFAPLPGSRREVEAIAKFYPERARIYLGDAATEAAVRNLDPAPRVVHLATHATLDERFPLSSAVVLSIPESPSAATGDGLLSAWEILQEVRLDADLVVLSACSSGLGKVLAGEGLIGLTRALHYAGARSLLASLWPIVDGSATDFMTLYHRNLSQVASPLQALHLTQVEMIEGTGGGEDPFVWAAFQLYGDGR